MFVRFNFWITGVKRGVDTLPRLLRICLLGVFILVSLVSNAQLDKYQITLMLTPSFENMNDRDLPNIFQYKLSYNLGAEFKLFLAPDVSVSSGVIFQNKGFRTTPQYTNPNITDGHIIISARYFCVPLNLDGHIPIAEKTDLVLSGGITGGRLFDETFVGRRLNGEEEIREGLFKTENDDRQTLDVFSDYYWGINLGFGICQYIKSKMVVAIEPFYRRQLNGAIDPTSAARGYLEPRFDSFSVDCKIGYYFNKNIKNYKKSF